MLAGSSGVARAGERCSELSSSDTPSRQIMSPLPPTRTGLGRVLRDIGARCASLISERSTLTWRL
eukprot:13616072-Alexandrium_andersonii.AAC.1